MSEVSWPKLPDSKSEDYVQQLKKDLAYLKEIATNNETIAEETINAHLYVFSQMYEKAIGKDEFMKKGFN